MNPYNSIDVGDKELPENIDDDEKEAMWCIIALTHDLGIALEKVTDINKKIRDMLSKFEIFNVEEISYPLICLPVDDLGIRLVSSDLIEVKTEWNDKINKSIVDDDKRYLTHIQSKYYAKFSEAFAKRRHGILGCLVLLRNLVYFLETDSSIDTFKPLIPVAAKQFLIRRNILRAIASHDEDNIYYQSVLDFSFLLLVFDEMHEFGRPRFLSMVERQGLTTDVTVKQLTPKIVHYMVEFSYQEKDELERKRDMMFQIEILQYFIRKCDKFRRVLRSAVKEDKKIRLILDIIDNATSEKKAYRLVHSNPQSVRMWIDNKKHSLRELNNLAEKKNKELSNFTMS